MDPPEPTAGAVSAGASNAAASAGASNAAASASASADLFFDAPDSLPPPPDPEITPSPPPNPQNTPPTPSPAPAATPPDDDTTSSVTSAPSSNPPALRRRRSSIQRIPTAADPANPNRESALTSKRSRILARDQNQEISTGSTVTAEPRVVEEPAAAVAAVAADPSPSLLVYLAGFVIKAIFFQINLLIRSFGFPIWLLYWSFLLVTNPFGTLRRGRDGATGKVMWVFRALIERAAPLVGGQGNLAARVVWGCAWAVYVCCVLLGLLVMAFFAASLVMGMVVEEPVRMTTELNFDYTKASPDAFVPLLPCDGGVCGLECGSQGGDWGRGSWRTVPPKHKLQMTISLTLPESEYNQKLGVFQVRAELLSAKGKVTSSSSQPCMLRFRSSHIRLMESFLKSGTLLAGYFSESQIVRLKLTGFVEGTEPTVCIRVTLEQRAEYKPGAGIPEIYAASLKLESELPLFKRIVWNWRRTVFIWLTMAFFMWELFLVLLCCRPVIIPGARPSGIPPSS